MQIIEHRDHMVYSSKEHDNELYDGLLITESTFRLINLDALGNPIKNEGREIRTCFRNHLAVLALEYRGDFPIYEGYVESRLATYRQAVEQSDRTQA